MNEKNRNSTLIASLMLAALYAATGSNAFAQWYAGGNVGQSRVSYSSSQLVTDLAAAGITGTGSVSNTDIGGKAFLGYRFNENLALEGGYFNMGRFTVNGSYTAPAPAGTFAERLKSQGGNVDVVGLYTMGNTGFALLGRLGGAYYHLESDTTVTGGRFVAFGNATSNKFVPEAGIGVQYDFTKIVSGRLEMQRYFKVGNSNTGSGDVDYYSAGMLVRF